MILNYRLFCETAFFSEGYLKIHVFNIQKLLPSFSEILFLHMFLHMYFVFQRSKILLIAETIRLCACANNY